MKVFSREAITHGGRPYGPGFFEVTDAEFYSLAQLGPVRPATSTEIDELAAAAAKPEQTEIEAAAVAPEVETAAAPRARSRRVAVERVPAGTL